MKLAHYSPDIITHVRSRRQGGKKRWSAYKPNGLWVSDESKGAYGWLQWCRDERFQPYRLRYKYEVKLVPNAKILYLRTTKDIDDFGHEYMDADGITNKSTAHIGPQLGLPRSIHEIDWHRVAKKYHGIIITPYNWEQRLSEHSWYYTWDCASGCIWNKQAIESITMVRERKVPRKPTAWEAKRKHKRMMDEMRKFNKVMRERLEKSNV